MKKKLLVIIALFIGVIGFSQSGKTNAKTIHKPVMVQITTNFGNIIIQLSDSTPLHRDNFVKLVKEHFFDSLLFHRVIQGFMIQGGDPGSKNADSLAMLGGGEGPGDRIPAEFNKILFHQKGALAAARDDNPQKASSNCQFYIVQGKKISDEQLNNIECNIRQGDPSFYYTDAQRKIYKTIGGTPMLDQNYTVFGQVIKGLDVIDKIAALPTDQNDRPLKNVRMKIKLLN